MQLKFARSKAEKGVLTKSWHYELRALLHVTPGERAALERYSFMKDEIFQAAGISFDLDDPVYVLLKKTKFEDLLTGQIYSNHNLQAILKVESAIKEACLTAQHFYEVADSFDGSERVIELDDGKGEVVARA